MTVGQLKAKLEGLYPSTHVCVIRESDGIDISEVVDVAVHRGTPNRHPDTQKALFFLDELGLEKWVFISTEEA